MIDFRYSLRGDVDLSAAPVIRADLQMFIAVSEKHLLVDCTQLTFIDSAGITVLLETHRDLEAVGRHMLITNVPRRSRRAFDAFGLTDLMYYDRNYEDGRGMLTSAS
jgi:anti-anti-sigma factor